MKKGANIMFPKNLHSIDRLVRLFVGIICVYLGFFATHIIDHFVLNLILGLFGILNLFAAAVSHCPVYHMSGVSTFKPSAKS